MIGTDIIEIARVREAIKNHGNHFLDRIFTAAEQAECQERTERYAGRFAAKEAIAKVLGTGFGKDLSWLDIEIKNEPSGRPVISLSSRAAERFGLSQLNISISHCKEYAIAVALKT